MPKNIPKFLKKILPYRIYYLLFGLLEDIAIVKLNIKKIDENCRKVAEISQMLISEEQRSHRHGINSHELSVYSQNGEDGILLYLFARIGSTNKTFVEFGVEDGRECNSANLIINHDWRGLLMDGNQDNVEAGRSYYTKMIGDESKKISFVREFITAENINKLILENGIEEEIDLLSIDIDGNDYWVWKAITCVKPRVVVVEYNASFGRDLSVTIPYDSNFIWKSTDYPGVFYTGASLACLNKLAQEKGYVLVGCDSYGVNAFFVRQDVAEGKVEAKSVHESFFPHASRTIRFGLRAQEHAVALLELEKI